jgi:hypothetical protein
MRGDTVSDAVEQLYAAFARYPLAPRIEGCPHCDLGRAERSLHAAPLRQLRTEDLGVYPFKAMTTFGTVDDFRHFLPRIAELLARDGVVHTTDLVLFAGKLVYGGLASWPERERVAVRAWLDALVDRFVGGEPGVVDAATLLEAHRVLGMDTESLLDRWAVSEHVGSIEALADFVVHGERRWASSVAARRAAIERTLWRGLELGADPRRLESALDVLPT